MCSWAAVPFSAQAQNGALMKTLSAAKSTVPLNNGLTITLLNTSAGESIRSFVIGRAHASSKGRSGRDPVTRRLPPRAARARILYMDRVWIAALLIVTGGCARPGRDVTREEGDFALLEFELRDCSSNDEHVGLERLLQNLYGTAPSIDLDRARARVRIPTPRLVDVPGIQDGFRRANTGLSRLRLTVRCTVRNGRVTLVPTGQEFGTAGGATDDPTPRWRVLRFPVPCGRKEPGAVFVE